MVDSLKCTQVLLPFVCAVAKTESLHTAWDAYLKRQYQRETAISLAYLYSIESYFKISELILYHIISFLLIYPALSMFLLSRVCAYSTDRRRKQACRAVYLSMLDPPLTHPRARTHGKHQAVRGREAVH